MLATTIWVNTALVPDSSCWLFSRNTWNTSILDASGNYLYPWDRDKFASNIHVHDLEEVVSLLMASTDFQSFHSVVNLLLPHPPSPQVQTNPPLEILSPVLGKDLPTSVWHIKVNAQWAHEAFRRKLIYWLQKEKFLHLITQLKDSIWGRTIWNYQYLTIFGL